MRLSELPEAVDITAGRYTRSEGSTSFYLNGDKNEGDNPLVAHFTVDDPGGRNDITKFHISFGSFNGHLWFDYGKPQNVDWDSRECLGQNIPTSRFDAYMRWVGQEWDGLCTMAEEFWAKTGGRDDVVSDDDTEQAPGLPVLLLDDGQTVAGEQIADGVLFRGPLQYGGMFYPSGVVFIDQTNHRAATPDDLG
jgi:hypothetical protein